MIGNFRFAGVAAGIKESGLPDLGMVYNPDAPVVACVYTSSAVKAAPVLLGPQVTGRGKLRAIVVNSGNANACTGQQGLADVARMQAVAARKLGISSDEVLVSSTGIIGQPLPMAQVELGISGACQVLHKDGLESFATAILTTDKGVKISRRQVALGGKMVSLCGVVKGAGMIAPNMATLLCYIFTDVAIEQACLDQLFRRAIGQTLNSISVDGDQSTNDTALVLADGSAGNELIKDSEGAGGQAFAAALAAVLAELALLVVSDGEGAAHVLDIRVTGARTDKDAAALVRSIGNSSLVKTAVHGKDPNWGRIVMAIGNAGVVVDPERISLQIGAHVIVERGELQEWDAQVVMAVMSRAVVPVQVDMGQGAGSATFLASDLGVEYVRFNAHYRT